MHSPGGLRGPLSAGTGPGRSTTHAQARCGDSHDRRTADGIGRRRRKARCQVKQPMRHTGCWGALPQLATGQYAKRTPAWAMVVWAGVAGGMLKEGNRTAARRLAKVLHRAHNDAVGAAAAGGPRRCSQDVYSYLAQSAIRRQGAGPVPAGSGRRVGIGRPESPVSITTVWTPHARRRTGDVPLARQGINRADRKRRA